MEYTLKITSSFERDFKKLDSLTQNRVLVALEKLRINPFIHSKKLQNIEVGIYRQRIGDYRLRFDVINKDIYLYRIRHRKDVYRK